MPTTFLKLGTTNPIVPVFYVQDTKIIGFKKHPDNNTNTLVLVDDGTPEGLQLELNAGITPFTNKLTAAGITLVDLT
jgi:hypothetical protein